MRSLKWSRGLIMLAAIIMTSCMDMGLSEGPHVQQVEIKEFKVGTRIELVAEPRPGFRFSHWSIGGEIVGQEEVFVLIMPNRDVNLQANFVRK